MAYIRHCWHTPWPIKTHPPKRRSREHSPEYKSGLVLQCLAHDASVRPVEALVNDQLRLLGAEALFNAFRPSNASNMVLELAYAKRLLTMTVRDDG